jgi:hypothetical protein
MSQRWLLAASNCPGGLPGTDQRILSAAWHSPLCHTCLIRSGSCCNPANADSGGKQGWQPCMRPCRMQLQHSRVDDCRTAFAQRVACRRDLLCVWTAAHRQCSSRRPARDHHSVSIHPSLIVAQTFFRLLPRRPYCATTVLRQRLYRTPLADAQWLGPKMNKSRRRPSCPFCRLAA